MYRQHSELMVPTCCAVSRSPTPGDTDYIVGEQVERSELLDENDRMIAADKLPAT